MISFEYGFDLLVVFLFVLVEVVFKVCCCGYEVEIGCGNMIVLCDMENFYEKYCFWNRILNFGFDIVVWGKGVFNLSDLIWGIYFNLEIKIFIKSYLFYMKWSIVDIWF